MPLTSPLQCPALAVCPSVHNPSQRTIVSASQIHLDGSERIAALVCYTFDIANFLVCFDEIITKLENVNCKPALRAYPCALNADIV